MWFYVLHVVIEIVDLSYSLRLLTIGLYYPVMSWFTCVCWREELVSISTLTHKKFPLKRATLFGYGNSSDLLTANQLFFFTRTIDTWSSVIPGSTTLIIINRAKKNWHIAYLASGLTGLGALGIKFWDDKPSTIFRIATHVIFGLRTWVLVIVVEASRKASRFESFNHSC